LEITHAAVDKLAEAGFDPVYGARPLKRAIQHQIENPLAQQILAGEYASGDVIHVHAEDDGLSFSKDKRQAA
jgi:ATP-dependent Clp protease ATP-binding subunit ClpB